MEKVLKFRGKSRRAVFFLLLFAIIVLVGTIVYHSESFRNLRNQRKLPQNILNICDVIEENADKYNVFSKKVITTSALVPYIQKYEGEVSLPYKKDAVDETTDFDGPSMIMRNMNRDNINWEVLSYYAAMEECNYLVIPDDADSTEILTTLGYQEIGTSDPYRIFQYMLQKDDYQDQWLITQYGNDNGSQIMFYTLQDQEGHLIVVDGGFDHEAEYVKSVLKSLGNHVDAWFLTHPHPDHIGAFCEIYPNSGSLIIDKIYTVDMAPPELCLEKAPWDTTDVYEKFLELDIPQLTYVHAGDLFKIHGLEIQVFNAYDDYLSELTKDFLNDGSMMFKVTASRESMLFCADVGKSLSNYLLEKYGDSLKADYIQMGHHGNGGLKKNFYKSIGAKAAFFDAPDWLMNDTTGKFNTPKNEARMRKYGCEIYSFATTPNQIILK